MYKYSALMCPVKVLEGCYTVVPLQCSGPFMVASCTHIELGIPIEMCINKHITEVSCCSCIVALYDFES